MAVSLIQDTTKTTYNQLAFYFSGLNNSKTYTIQIMITDAEHANDAYVLQQVRVANKSVSDTFVYDAYGDIDSNLFTQYESEYDDCSADGFTHSHEYYVWFVYASTDNTDHGANTVSIQTKTATFNNSEQNFDNVQLYQVNSNITDSQVAYQIRGLPYSYSDAYGYVFYVDIYNENYTRVNTAKLTLSPAINLTSSPVYTFSGLKDGKTYRVVLTQIDYYINQEAYSVYPSAEVYITTIDNQDDYYPQFQGTSILHTGTINSITVILAELDENYVSRYGYRIKYRLYDGVPGDSNTEIVDETLFMNIASGITETSHTFTGLEANKRYYAAVRFQYQEYGILKYFPNEFWEDYGVDYGQWDFYAPVFTSGIVIPSISTQKISQVSAENQFTSISLKVTGISKDIECGWKYDWTITNENGNVVATNSQTCYTYDDTSYGDYFNGETILWTFNASEGKKYYASIVVSYAVKDDTIWYEAGEITGGPFTTVINDDGGGARNAILSLSASYSSILATISNLDSSYYNSKSRTIVWSIKDLDHGGNEVVYPSATLANYSSYTSKTFSDLQSETTYIITAKITYLCKDGTYGTIQFAQVVDTTEAESFDFSKFVITVTQGSPSTSALVATVSGLDTDYPRSDGRVYWSINGGSYVYISFSAGASSVSKTFTGLASGSTYTFKAYITYTENSKSLSTEIKDADGTTAIPSATLTLSATATKITAIISGLDEAYVQGGRTAEWRIRAASTSIYTRIETTDIPNQVPDISYIFTDLTVSTKYYVQVIITYNSGTKTLTESITTKNRPDLFSWTSTVAQGYTWQQHNNGGYYGITANEWGRLLDNINNVREYFDLPLFPVISLSAAKGQSYPQGFTYPSSGDEFLAIYFNQALAAVAGIYSEKMSMSGVYNNAYVRAGKDPITAECLNNLVLLLNKLE